MGWSYFGMAPGCVAGTPGVADLRPGGCRVRTAVLVLADGKVAFAELFFEGALKTHMDFLQAMVWGIRHWCRDTY